MSDTESKSYFETLSSSLKDIFTRKEDIPRESDEERRERLMKQTGLTKEIIDAEIKQKIAKETGWDRVKELFKYDETIGAYSSFLTENLDILTSVFIGGFILGGLSNTAQTAENFKRNTQLVVYTDKKAATRDYSNFVISETLKGGIKMGSRFAIFTGTIVGSSVLIQVYRNKSTFFDYVIGGVLSGGLFRMHYGLYNLITGATVGGIMGTIFGAARFSQLKYMEMTYEERRHRIMTDKILEREVIKRSSIQDT